MATDTMCHRLDTVIGNNNGVQSMKYAKVFRVKRDCQLPIRYKSPSKEWCENSVALHEGELIIYRGSTKRCERTASDLGSNVLPLDEIHQYYMDNFNNNEPIRNFNNKLFNTLIDDGVIVKDDAKLI